MILILSGNQGLQSVFINDEPGSTMTYFTARSLLAYCANTRQVVR